MGERKAEDCLGLLLLSTRVLVVQRTLIHLERDHLEIQPVLCTLSGGLGRGGGGCRHGLQTGPLPGAAEAPLGHRLLSCSFNLECYTNWSNFWPLPSGGISISAPALGLTSPA